MLSPYRKSLQKVTMGLFSLSPELKDMDLINEVMSWYENHDDRQILLWKDELDNWSGVVGMEVTDNQALIHQLILGPQVTKQSNYNQVFDELSEMFSDRTIVCGFDKRNEFLNWENARND